MLIVNAGNSLTWLVWPHFRLSKKPCLCGNVRHCYL